MSAVEETGTDRLWEAALWIACLTIAATSHGVGAWLLLRDLSAEMNDSGIDAPVVMLELPEALAPSMAPAQDLPPGPIEEEENKPTPPKEEAKPPEPEAEVALPLPEPPKPEMPAEEKQATAPPAAKVPPSVMTRWQTRLAAHIERFRRYPAEARSRGEQGVARVAFTIDREGRLLKSRIEQSSGSASLDQETLAMLSRAQPMPRPPDQLSSAEITFVLPIRFDIK